MTRPLTSTERQLLDQLVRTGQSIGVLAARDPHRAREIRNTAARAQRALGTRNLDHAIQIHRTSQETPAAPEQTLTAAAQQILGEQP
ncbi:hypothetical protein [Kitasatospora sp. CB01950]|uniref:hypothetical protein n=1 Tax=Kitasatospora sp. CB01950 TaxID=1703930 RepID=UPI00093DFC27|nr:hypothetical protein [Kitasatospora sp. CB01950]OKJ06814.1 hypothetical protein AMK19_23455 [Kitasatospora sp. CB01950]